MNSVPKYFKNYKYVEIKYRRIFNNFRFPYHTISNIQIYSRFNYANTILQKYWPICLTADLSAETLQARREWQDIFKVLKQKNLQPRLVYKRYKRRKKIYKINPKQLENSNRNIYIKNKFKCCKQKTQTG